MSKVFFEGLADYSNSPADQPIAVQTDQAAQRAARKAGYVAYYNDMVQYTKPTQITSDCAEIAFYNQGTSNVILNGIIFAPMTGVSFNGNQNEIDTTRYNLSFTGAGQNICFVIRKCYVD